MDRRIIAAITGKLLVPFFLVSLLFCSCDIQQAPVDYEAIKAETPLFEYVLDGPLVWDIGNPDNFTIYKFREGFTTKYPSEKTYIGVDKYGDKGCFYLTLDGFEWDKNIVVNGENDFIHEERPFVYDKFNIKDAMYAVLDYECYLITGGNITSEQSKPAQEEVLASCVEAIILDVIRVSQYDIIAAMPFVFEHDSNEALSGVYIVVFYNKGNTVTYCGRKLTVPQ